MFDSSVTSVTDLLPDDDDFVVVDLSLIKHTGTTSPTPWSRKVSRLSTKLRQFAKRLVLCCDRLGCHRGSYRPGGRYDDGVYGAYGLLRTETVTHTSATTKKTAATWVCCTETTSTSAVKTASTWTCFLNSDDVSPIPPGGGRRGGCGSYGRPPGRPLSAVSSMGTGTGTGSYSAGCSPATPRHSAVLPPPPPEFLLPDICEFNPGAAAQYASSSVLDDSGSLNGDALQEALRTRSLPSSVRTKQKPLASEEDLDELYAKVNFSKKRKNRMRHDEAAIIAICKSRSQFLDKIEADQDTLVDNEAVIVYNERTAL